MDRYQRYNEIVTHFIPTRSPNTIEVEKYDGSKLFGFFVIPDDSALRGNQILQFVTNSKATSYRDSPEEQANRMDIDVEDIRNIRLYNSHNNHEQYSLSF